MAATSKKIQTSAKRSNKAKQQFRDGPRERIREPALRQGQAFNTGETHQVVNRDDTDRKYNQDTEGRELQSNRKPKL